MEAFQNKQVNNANWIKDFKEECVLGQGTYGRVTKVYHKDEEKLDPSLRKYYAKKVIDLSFENDGIPATSLRELSIMTSLARFKNENPNVLLLEHKYTKTTTSLEMVLDYFEYDLNKFLKNKISSLPNPDLVKKQIILEIIKGVEFLHSKRVIHRDLKPQNILVNLTPTFQLKIADFGLARSYSIPSKPYTLEVMTLPYRPPELILGCMQYSTPVDIWSVGCIVAEILTGRTLFSCNSETEMFFKMVSVLGSPTPETWPTVKEMPNWQFSIPFTTGEGIEKHLNDKGITDKQAISLIECCLQMDPIKRKTAKELLQHSYFLS